MSSDSILYVLGLRDGIGRVVGSLGDLWVGAGERRPSWCWSLQPDIELQ